MDQTFKQVEIAFTVIFAVELAINAFGTWMWEFLADTWNIFDTIVVIVSIVGLAVPGLPAVNVLRLVRVFKMVRLFRKLTALRILIHALAASVVPVLYSFVILLLVTSVYAVLATEFFASQDSVNFGTFALSLYTLFQVASGDSWSSVISRGLMAIQSTPASTSLVACFFVSYVLIVGVVLMNIVVAVGCLDAHSLTLTHTHRKTERERERHTHTNAHARARARTHTYTYTHTHSHICLYHAIRSEACHPHIANKRARKRSRTLAHTHARTHARTHTHTHTQISQYLSVCVCGGAGKAQRIARKRRHTPKSHNSKHSQYQTLNARCCWTNSSQLSREIRLKPQRSRRRRISKPGWSSRAPSIPSSILSWISQPTRYPAPRSCHPKP